MLDPVIQRVVESGAPGLLMSGDPHEGPLLRGVRAEPLPPGRARLVRRRDRAAVVQLGYVETPGALASEPGGRDVQVNRV